MVLKEIPTENFTRPLGRNEVIGLLFRLTVFGAVTYFTIKWMVDAVDPTRKQKMEAQKQAEKLMKQIGVKNVKLSEYEMSIAAHLVDPLNMQITWSDIAGLDDVITELKDTVILPIQKRHLFEGSRLLQPPKGVLLYGPPGCGKTLIAKATAKEAGFRFINLQPSTLTDKWYGESQKLAAAVFSLAIKLQPSIIFIDEIDSFLRSRSSSDHEATAMMKAQFMSLWDGLDTDYNCQVIVMGATNRPQDLDSAILRRMPTRFHINQPNHRQREEILKLILENENVDTLVDLREVAKDTDGFSGSDLREMCRDSALLCVRDYVHNNTNESR
ncbi:ATD1B protein, partial [Polyodon spathula]|nr:ATD1B protein [Polyodon spathula]